MLIIDSNYLAYVNKYAYSVGLSYKGNPTEIVFGFLRCVIDLARRFESNNFVFCWDSKHSKRRDMFPSYKWKRRADKSQEDIMSDQIAYGQFDELRLRVLPELGFNNIFMQNGYESDDIIASIAIENSDPENIVVSSDNDLYQLLNHCSLYNYTKRETTTKTIFKRMYGIDPSDWISVKTLVGCVTDNVPGIDGVGDKKAIAFLKGEMKSGKTFDKILTHDEGKKELTRKLVTLPFYGTMSCEIRNNNFSLDKYHGVCAKHGFNSLLSDDNLLVWKKLFC
jgi:5'-3' exonuclease